MDEGVITLTCTIASVINVWFCVFNILGKKKTPNGIFFYIMLFSMYWYIHFKSLKSV